MPLGKKLADLGEFGLIARIASHVANTGSVITGIGDDAAVTSLTPGMHLLTSTDMLLEDVHFRWPGTIPTAWGASPWRSVSPTSPPWGAFPVGRCCRWPFLPVFPSISSTNSPAVSWQWPGEHGVALIGGDTCSSRSGLVVSVTIMGEQLPELILRRSGARTGRRYLGDRHSG